MSDLDNIKLPSFNFGDPESDPEPKPEKQRKTRSDKGKPRGPRGSKKQVVSDKDLKLAIEEILVFPAIPSALLYPTLEGKMYLLNHFIVTSPWGADRLVEASKYSPALRSMLENIRGKTAAGVLISFAIVFLGGPITFILGKQNVANMLTSIATIDESAMQKLAEQMQTDMMQGVMQQMFTNQQGSQNGTNEWSVSGQSETNPSAETESE